MKALVKRSLFLGLLLAFTLSSGLAQAKTLDAGTFYLEPKVGLYGNSNQNIGSMFSYGAEAGYFVLPGLSIGAEALGYLVNEKKYPVNGLNGSNNWETANAFSPIAIVRYHFINEDRYSLFVGAGVGGFFSDRRVPINGYTSNLTEIAETGVSVSLTDMLSLQLAGRWQHIGEYTSNKGADNWGGNLAVKFVF